MADEEELAEFCATKWPRLVGTMSVLFRHLPGTAIKIDGEWKVSRETMCEHLARGGIICPPRNGSTG